MYRPVPQHVAPAREDRALRNAAQSPPASSAGAAARPRRLARRLAALFGAASVAIAAAGCMLPYGSQAPSAAAAADTDGPDEEAELAALREQREAQFQANEPYRPANLPQLSLTPPMLY